MLQIFPDQTDDLLDVAALPPTDRTELDYRTRPLSAERELRLTLLWLVVCLPALTLLGLPLQLICAWIPGGRHLVVAAGVLFAMWIVGRRLTGALQKHDVFLAWLFVAGCAAALAWHLALLQGAWALRGGLLAAWITGGLVARQAAAWILAGPAVDRDRRHKWREYLPELLPSRFSPDCPERLTYAVSPLLLLCAWYLSLWLLWRTGTGLGGWPCVFAASALAVWLAWHAAALPWVPFPHVGETCQATWRGMVIYVTYDVYHTRAAGVFRFPTRWLRPPPRRWALLAATLLAIGFGYGVHCPSPLDTFRGGGSFWMQWGANFLGIALAGPLALLVTLWLSAGTLLARFERELSEPRDAESTDWDIYVDRILNSEDELEREHLLLGFCEAGDYPVLVHREIYNQHAHILGDSGASKTALAIGPQAVQLIARADCTVVVIDLKGDRALFETCRREAARTGRLQFRWIANEVGQTTFGFNPFLQSHNEQLSVDQLTQQLLQGLSLDYGLEYGAGYFTAMNEIVLRNVLRETGAGSFEQLDRDLADRGWYRTIGHEQDWEQARHLASLVQRLGGSPAVNLVPDDDTHPPEVHRQAIDVAELLREPQVVYLWLRSAVEPTNAPAIARLFLWSMFTAASHRPSDGNRVYCFIDEMQQILSDGMKLVFEQFRDLGGTIIAAHQAAGQLRRQGTDLGDTIDSCTAVKQVLRASDLDSLERLEKLSGITADTTATWYQPYERGSGDLDTRYEEIYAAEGLVRVAEKDRVRYDRDALQAISSRRQSSLVRFTFGSGYTQFAGRSIPMRSEYAISYQEYLKRRQAAWPAAAGAFRVRPPVAADVGVPTPHMLADQSIAEGDFGGEFDHRGRPATMEADGSGQP